VIEQSHNTCEALVLIPSATKTKKKFRGGGRREDKKIKGKGGEGKK
jgi:hypothetical protein